MKASVAAAMAGIFGLTNIFSRPLGGVLSDVCYKHWGVRGRLWLQFIVLFTEASFLFGFGFISNDQPVALAALVLFCFSVSCEMGCGSSYGIVPFMNKDQKAIVGALIGAGGNVGAVISAQCFYKKFSDDLLPYKIHGAYVMCGALARSLAQESPVGVRTQLCQSHLCAPFQTIPQSEPLPVSSRNASFCNGGSGLS